MVKRTREVKTHYICEKCGQWYMAEDQAKLCESKELSKQCSDKNWNVGDIVILSIHDDDYHIALITSQYVEGHQIFPIYEFLDSSGTKKANCIDGYIDAVLDDEKKKRIISWGVILKDQKVKK